MTRSRSRDYSASKAVLNSLEARELSLRKAKVERVTVVKFRVNKRSGDSFSSGIIEERAYTTKTTDMVEMHICYWHRRRRAHLCLYIGGRGPLFGRL